MFSYETPIAAFLAKSLKTVLTTDLEAFKVAFVETKETKQMLSNEQLREIGNRYNEKVMLALMVDDYAKATANAMIRDALYKTATDYKTPAENLAAYRAAFAKPRRFRR